MRKNKLSEHVIQAFYQAWYQGGYWTYILLPFEMLFRFLVYSRRKYFQWGLGSCSYPAVPTIVIGNINLGGGGKSPVVAALIKHFSALGYQPGVVARGYGRTLNLHQPVWVKQDTSVLEVGDEPKMLFEQTSVPIVVYADRTTAVKFLLENAPEVDLVLSDDGMQHYSLGRDLEVLVVNDTMGFGNGRCLPVGPLREPMNRLESIDVLMRLGSQQKKLQCPLNCVSGEPYDAWFLPVVSIQSKVIKVRAVAGISHPQLFFQGLRERGFEVEEIAFPDHHAYCAQDFAFDDASLPIFMTEKDAVKCAAFARDHWYKVPLEIVISEDKKTEIMQKLMSNLRNRGLKHYAN